MEEQVQTKPSDSQEVAEEIPEEDEDEETGGGITNLLSPAGVIFFPLAILIDLIGIILIFFALDDFFITDIIAVSTIGFWIYSRSGKMKVTKGTSKKLKTKASKIAKRLKWLRPVAFIGEFIPYVGVVPLWTILVYNELINES